MNLRNLTVSWFFLLFFLRFVAIAQGPKFPMYGIVSNGDKAYSSLNSADYLYLSATYRMLYSSFSPAEADSLRKYKPSIDILKYINTAEFSSTRIRANKIQKFKWIEENERRMDIAYYELMLINSI